MINLILKKRFKFCVKKIVIQLYYMYFKCKFCLADKPNFVKNADCYVFSYSIISYLNVDV